MKHKNNMPAFPLAYQELDAKGTPIHAMHINNGMTLRDYFAAATMQAIIAAPPQKFTPGNLTDIAEDAYTMADHMLAARENEQ